MNNSRFISKNRNPLPPIVFFNDGFDWELPGNRYYIPTILAKQTPILIVAPRSSFHESVKRLLIKEPELKIIAKNLYYFKPYGKIPFNHTIPLFETISLYLIKHQIKNLIKTLFKSKPILWFFHADYFQNFSSIPHAHLIFHAVDDYTQYSFKYPTQTSISNIKKKIAFASKKSDLIFTTSQTLTKKFPSAKTYQLNNGVDFATFQSKKSIPTDMSKLKRPVIGFIGNMASFRFDVNLIGYLATRNPNFSFVLIGPTKDQQEQIVSLTHQYPNVAYLGSKSKKQLPHYVQHFDVGIIPYLLNTYTQSVLPLKFFEYCAAGIPTISTNLPSLKPYRQFVTLTTTYRQFDIQIKRQLKKPTSKKTLISLAKNHDWHTIVNTSTAIIKKSLSHEK